MVAGVSEASAEAFPEQSRESRMVNPPERADSLLSKTRLWYFGQNNVVAYLHYLSVPLYNEEVHPQCKNIDDI